MAKQSENTLAFETELNKEFNPVKLKLEGMSARELLESFAEYYYSNNRSVQPLGLHIDSFLEQFNPVKEEKEVGAGGGAIKTTAAYDNSRLEFLRMQIGPVQSFYQTLGNILFSLSMRLDVVEAKIEGLNKYIGEQSETRTNANKTDTH